MCDVLHNHDYVGLEMASLMIAPVWESKQSITHPLPTSLRIPPTEKQHRRMYNLHANQAIPSHNPS